MGRLRHKTAQMFVALLPPSWAFSGDFGLISKPLRRLWDAIGPSWVQNCPNPAKLRPILDAAVAENLEKTIVFLKFCFVFADSAPALSALLLEGFWAARGRSWAPLVEVLGGSWAGFGRVFGGLGGVLGLSRAVLSPLEIRKKPKSGGQQVPIKVSEGARFF